MEIADQQKQGNQVVVIA